jgi:hypothetical protein
MYGNGNGCGFGGDWSSWIILFLLFGMFNGNGWGGGFGGGMCGADGLYPWLNNSQNINGGFRDQMLNTSINGIQNSITSGFGDVQTSLCNGFAGVNATINSGFAGAEASANARQMANMNQAFAAQTAMSQGFNGLQAQFADCCCENRLANCQTQNVIQSEGSQTRFADANNTRDIIENQTRSTQAILDKLCALELDGVKGQLAQAQRENVGLQNQLNMATMQASQTAQTAQILAGQAAEIDGVYNRLKNCPVPSMPVYGNQPIFTCNNGGCGCGNNGF